MKSLHLLSNLTIKNIINILKEEGPLPPSRISRLAKISPSTASRCLQTLKDFNIVSAKWSTGSIDDRPLKIYALVPNIIRFEFILNEGKKKIKNDHYLILNAEDFVEYKKGDKRVVYLSLNDAPFKFDGLAADLLKEIEKGNDHVNSLKNKFKGEDFDSTLKNLLLLGVLDVKQRKE